MGNSKLIIILILGSLCIGIVSLSKGFSVRGLLLVIIPSALILAVILCVVISVIKDNAQKAKKREDNADTHDENAKQDDDEQ